MLATLMARLVSGGINFLINRKVIFGNTDNGAKQALRFFILFFCIMCASSLIVSALWFLPIPVTLTKAIVDLLLWTVNYKMQRIWVFKDSNRIKRTPKSKRK
jgi:putative flippase GtrA